MRERFVNTSVNPLGDNSFSSNMNSFHQNSNNNGFGWSSNVDEEERS